MLSTQFIGFNMLHCPTCGRHYSAAFEICPDDQSPLQADATAGGPSPVDPLVGHTLDDKYHLEARLGIGGMGTVYRARHLLIDRPVAVKVLNQRFVEDEAARTRFRREARAAGRLQHTNAVTVTDFGESNDGYVYLVMELLEGRTLRDMAPEQCDGAELTPAADVYSLGVILYEMLAGTVPFSGSTPLAIAMKHTSEIPRSPRDFVSTIPPALEEIVLHTLEKHPQDRPANAEEFRKQLLATAERLGLEHAAVTSSPNLKALRDIGTESPSGRLVIDISRLRENRATNSGASEITVIGSSSVRSNETDSSGRAAQTAKTSSFPRVSIPLNVMRRSRRQIVMIAAIVAAVLLIGITIWVRSRNAALATNAVVAASPSPSVTPSPSPTPAETPRPREKKPVVKPTEEEKPKKPSLLNRVKRILKKPF